MAGIERKHHGLNETRAPETQVPCSVAKGHGGCPLGDTASKNFYSPFNLIQNGGREEENGLEVSWI